jgi:hypothetical protein
MCCCVYVSWNISNVHDNTDFATGMIASRFLIVHLLPLGDFFKYFLLLFLFFWVCLGWGLKYLKRVFLFPCVHSTGHLQILTGGYIYI